MSLRGSQSDLTQFFADGGILPDSAVPPIFDANVPPTDYVKIFGDLLETSGYPRSVTFGELRGIAQPQPAPFVPYHQRTIQEALREESMTDQFGRLRMNAQQDLPVVALYTPGSSLKK